MKRRFTSLVTSFAALSLLAGGAYGDDSKNKNNDPDAIGIATSAAASTSTRSRRRSRLASSCNEVERQAKIVDDPIIAEYVNRVGQNIVRNSDPKCRHHQSAGHRRGKRLRSSGRILLRQLR